MFAELEDGDEISWLFVVPANLGNDLPGRAFLLADDVGDVLSRNEHENRLF
ncbi:hypothetical protein OCK74_27425 [Chitinophagaceae bacterium LB-8]|uniref:Uncharacterized protein n=1 Tax=Paraflavisolibacter caeni TaxID=2982496 RepID=A0A9X2Y0G7_9BACT|nr:hypothetical protein [Paraflavisolibacter caeni]MCU7552881.1 hypothetical protein [Paraflavisolibacter caeni]